MWTRHDGGGSTWRVLGGAAFLLLATCAGPASAAGDATRGEDISRRLCSPCHAIRGPGPSRVEQAPPFSGFARRWPLDNLGEALAEGIITGHGEVRMPEFVFTPRDIDDLLAYLASVQQ